MIAVVLQATVAEAIGTLGTPMFVQDQALGQTAHTHGSQYPCTCLAGLKACSLSMGASAELPRDSQQEKDSAVQYNVDVQVTNVRATLI